MWDGDGHGFRHVWFKPTLSSLLKVFLSADRFSKLGKLAGFDTSLISWSQSERVYHRGRRRVSTVCVCVFFFNLASDVTRTRRRGILALLMKRRAIIKAASYWSPRSAARSASQSDAPTHFLQLRFITRTRSREKKRASGCRRSSFGLGRKDLIVFVVWRLGDFDSSLRDL